MSAVNQDEDDESFNSGSDKYLSEEEVNIQTIASKVHDIDVKKKIGQKALQRVMPELCEKVIEGEKRGDVQACETEGLKERVFELS